jgi:hypothetical protein
MIAGPTGPAGSNLDLSRRADWRFLLPRPELGNVGCSDRAGPDLVAACAEFAASVSPLGEERLRELDVVVLVDPAGAEVSEAARALRAGGWLYAELRPRLRPSRLRAPGRCVAALRELGFAEIEINVHWPSFETCVEIFSPHDPAPARAWLGRRGGRHRRVQTSLLRLALRLGLLGRVAPVSIVARAPAPASP